MDHEPVEMQFSIWNAMRLRKIGIKFCLLALLGLAGCGGSSSTPTPTQPVLFIYVVSQTSQQVLNFKQDSSNAITSLSTNTTTTLQPSSLLIHPSKALVYIANAGSNNV